jgi:type IX secretion system substrate protein
MKREIFIIILLLSFQGLRAQINIVPNYSFEDTLHCVNGDNEFQGYVANWEGNESGLCYFNALCNSPSSDVNIPLNVLGYQYPHSGNAYAGIYTFIGPPPPSRPNDSNTRDYMQVQLMDTLHGGVKYYITFYVSLADSFKYACNDIGAYFSDSSLALTGYAKPYIIPQIANNNVKNPLTDKINWIKVSGNFIAKGGEKYVVIGNFKNDKQSDSVFVNSPNSNTNYNWNGSYYYVDDIIASTDSVYADSLFSGINEINAKQPQVMIFPNPSKGKFTISLEGFENKSHLEVYNLMGELIYEEEILPHITPIDLSNNSDGIYLYRIASGNSTSTGKLIIQ